MAETLDLGSGDLKTWFGIKKQMSTARLGRGTKSKVFLYICCILVLGTVIYVFHGTQSQLEDVKKAASICSQQQESLSAQLQVIFEYKLRLEKSLQKEKAEHRQNKEKLLAQLEEEKQSKQKEILENSNKLNSIQEKYDLLQNEHKSLNDEFTELKNKQNENNEAQQELKKQAEDLKNQLEVIKTEKDQLIEKLKEENENLLNDKRKLINENEELSKNFQTNDDNVFYKNKNIELESKVKELSTQLQTCTSAAKEKETKYEENAALEVQEKQPMFNEIQPGDNKYSMSGISNKVSKLLNSSTTPFINPQAIDHDNNHDSNNNIVSSAKPLADPLLKAVGASIDENAADEKEDKLVEEQDKVMPIIPEEEPRNEAQNLNSGSDVIAPPPLNN